MTDSVLFSKFYLVIQAKYLLGLCFGRCINKTDHLKYFNFKIKNDQKSNEFQITIQMSCSGETENTSKDD